MKPQIDTLAIVTATLDPVRAADCFKSWLGRSRFHYPVYVVWSILPGFPPVLSEKDRQAYEAWTKQGSYAVTEAFAPGVTTLFREGGGVVPAFAQGVMHAFKDGAQAVLCLHDDVLMEEDDWDRWLDFPDLDLIPRFAGFGGSRSLGSPRIYHDPYDPMQLARGAFASNLREAEQHGRRTKVAEPAVVFDGFAQFGTQDWFEDAWRWLWESGIQHHAYDAALGCLAARARVPGVLLPVQCHHFGGATAVGNADYQQWAKSVHPQGDQGFWIDAHRTVYSAFRDVLPVQVKA